MIRLRLKDMMNCFSLVDKKRKTCGVVSKMDRLVQSRRSFAMSANQICKSICNNHIEYFSPR